MVSVDANLARCGPSLSSIPAPLPARVWFFKSRHHFGKMAHMPQTHQEHYCVYRLKEVEMTFYLLQKKAEQSDVSGPANGKQMPKNTHRKHNFSVSLIWTICGIVLCDCMRAINHTDKCWKLYCYGIVLLKAKSEDNACFGVPKSLNGHLFTVSIGCSVMQ